MRTIILGDIEFDSAKDRTNRARHNVSYMKRKSSKTSTELVHPTLVEDRAIKRAIKADPDTRQLSADDFKRMRPFNEVMRQRGRPKSPVHKLPVTVRLDPEIVEYFKAGGRGWQTRMNAALAEYVGRRRRART